MKTAEEKVKKVGIYPEDFISSGGYLAVVNLVNDLDQKASSELKTAIDLLSKSDQQNKEKDAEIQRLTKEVEEYKKELAIERDDNEDLRRLRDSFRTALNERNVELTRLRELGKQIYNEIFIKTEEGDRIFPDQIDFGKITDLLKQ